jgi:peptide/nickel transport system ATP-binding protein
VVADIADEVLVMYAGRAVEFGTVRDVFYDAQMPYTWGLLESVPSHTARSADRLTTIPGAPPSLLAVPAGCPFHPRCTHRAAATGDCAHDLPSLAPESGNRTHLARCHIPDDVRRQIFQGQLREPV